MTKKAICKNCSLYNFQKQHCNVLVLFEGERINPPTSPEDACLFTEEYTSINDKNEVEKWTPEVQEVNIWCEDPATGKRSDKGVVKIEYPEGFFGKPMDIFTN